MSAAISKLRGRAYYATVEEATNDARRYCENGKFSVWRHKHHWPERWLKEFSWTYPAGEFKGDAELVGEYDA